MKLRMLFMAIGLLCCLLPLDTSAQSRTLKMTYGQIQNKTWSGTWPGWSGWNAIHFPNEVLLKVDKLDREGKYFRLILTYNQEVYTFNVHYDNYNPYQEWYSYKDFNGNEVTIEGTYLGYLADYGWPGTGDVQIYFWGHNEGVAIALR